jgi:hypothetical protein
LKIIERENTILLGQAEVRRDDGCAGGTSGFFLSELRAEDRWQILGAGRMLTLPAFGGGEIDESERDLLLLAGALGTAVLHDGADHLVAENKLIAAVFEDEALALRSLRLGRFGNVEWVAVLRVQGRGCRQQAAGGTQHYDQRADKPASHVSVISVET